jgi:hypothetical protein
LIYISTSLLLIDEYQKIIKQLNKNNCWACQEGLAGNSSMHDCEEDFHMIIEYFFDEATFFVNSKIRIQDFNFPGVENIQDAVWHLFGRSFLYIIKQVYYSSMLLKEISCSLTLAEYSFQLQPLVD